MRKRWATRYLPAVAVLLILSVGTVVVPRSVAAFIGNTGNTTPSFTASSDFISGTLQRWGFETLAPANPTQFGTGTWSAASSAEDHSCAIKAADSTLWCWGWNAIGQLGLGSISDGEMVHGPMQVGSSTYTAVSAGHNFTCAIRSTGAMYCWGENAYGQLGVGDTTDRSSPTLVLGGITTWTQVSAGDSGTCAVRGVSHTLYCWGNNGNGQVGVGDNTQRNSPAQVTGNIWSKVALLWGHVCATKTDTTLWCWGSGVDAKLAQGADTADKLTPVQVSGTGWVTPTVGNSGSCAVKSTNALYCWGDNSLGQLGVGDTTDRTTPAVVTGSWSTTALSAAAQSTCAVRTTGTLWCWGANNNMNVGVSDTAVHNAPVQTSSNTTWVEVSEAYTGGCARRSDNTLWCWGGMAATGAFTYPVSSPGQVGALATWKSVAVGFHEMCAIRTDSTLWCVGFNDSGQLGQNDQVGLATPAQVVPGSTWMTVAAGNGHTCGVKTDYTLWCWGGNWVGQLGNGNSTWQWQPVAIDSANRYVAVAAGEGSTCAIRNTTYYLFCWGWNDLGQLGTANTTQYSTPQQAGGNNAWSTVSLGKRHGCAVRRTTGALYCWGWNAYGQLGNNTTTSSTSPVLIDSGNAYSAVGVGMYHSCGVRTSGALYCWGENADGQLGQGNTTDRLVPTRVGTGSNWYSPAIGYFFGCASQVDRTVWCWGNNGTGQLGQGTLTDNSSPVQVPGILSRNIAAGKAAVYAVDLS
jgi:alpha-tubulin suppressor-like RCC1 family protein